MTDPRLTPCNGRVAPAELEGRVSAERFVEGELVSCVSGSAGLYDRPNGYLSRELLFGDSFRILERDSGWAFGQRLRDGYVGYALEREFDDHLDPSHWVCCLGTHIYSMPDIKSVPVRPIPFGARVAATSIRESFLALRSGGFVPEMHLKELKDKPEDPVAVAEIFMGVPYLWGGNSPQGIDCSGLVQIALEVTGASCPRDADMQEDSLGRMLDVGQRVERGDLAFWKGHVAIALDSSRLIHASGHHMLVVEEPILETLERIAEQSETPFHGFRRIFNRQPSTSPIRTGFPRR